MIEVIRKDYPEMQVRRRRGGKLHTVPAHYHCSYKFEGREIAHYDSSYDCLYLKSALLEKGRKYDDMCKRLDTMTVYERALECPYADAFKYLFEMLGVDANSNVSEYVNF